MDTAQPDSRRPLQGIRIVDVSTVLMGPVATQILADYGADVIKVEPPEGDIMRNAGPMRNAGMGPMFLHANRNKRSVVLDLKQPVARRALLKISATADAFVHNVRPAAMARLKLSFADLAAVSQSIVYLALTGFGQQGPYAARTAIDDVIQAGSGLAMLYAANTGHEPAYIPSVLADRITGISAANALMAALIHRLRTGKGQAVEVPMFETVAAQVLGDHLGGEAFIPAVGPMGYSRLLTRYRKPYRTLDGYLSATVYTDKQWRVFMEATEAHAMLADPRLKSTAGRANHYDEVYRFLEDVFSRRTTAQWLELLEALDIPCMRVNSLDDLLADPHLAAVRLLQDMDHPTEGLIRTMRVPSSWSDCDVSIRRPPPTLGEHTREVLEEAGVDSRDIEQLLAGALKRKP